MQRTSLEEFSNGGVFFEVHMRECDRYLRERDQGDRAYHRRSKRYLDVILAMTQLGLTHDDTVIDVGAGWTEFDYCLRTTASWRGRYIPVDGSHNGINLDSWRPIREAEYMVCLETLEHLNDPQRLVYEMRARCIKGLFVSTPNPDTTDVLGMDRTHRTPIRLQTLISWGANRVWTRSYYGKDDDSLLAYFAGHGFESVPIL